jgi:hypothetical protein
MTDRGLGQLASELRALELRRQQGPLSGPEAARRQELLDRLIERLRQHPGAERRRHLRIPADLEVRFRMGGATITCMASELGYGGLGLRGHLWIIEDQELIVENLRLGTRDYPMAMKARVVWKLASESSRPGAGLAFIDVDEAGRRQIRAVFERLFAAYLEKLAATVTPDV